MQLAVIANEEDPCGDHVAAHARDRGVTVVRRSLRGLVRGDAISWSIGDGGVDALLQVDAAFVRQFPSLPALLGPPAQTLSHAEHDALQRQQRDRQEFALSLIASLEQRGARVVNPIASRPFDDKPCQLDALSRAGLPVPRTLVSNDPTAIDRFCEQVGDCVIKPVGGGAAARLWSSVDAAARQQLRRAPVIAQQRVQGVDVRVHVVAGRVVSAVTIASDTLDYRADPRWQAGEPMLGPATLDDSDAALCVRAAGACHQTFSGIDAKRTPQGALVLLECNGAPVFLEPEQRFGHPITTALVDALTG